MQALPVALQIFAVIAVPVAQYDALARPVLHEQLVFGGAMGVPVDQALRSGLGKGSGNRLCIHVHDRQAAGFAVVFISGAALAAAAAA